MIVRWIGSNEELYHDLMEDSDKDNDYVPDSSDGTLSQMYHPSPALKTSVKNFDHGVNTATESSEVWHSKNEFFAQRGSYRIALLNTIVAKSTGS
ncbi:hypothetical protein PoB_006780900 [Plakobranchus ocellatus]|uniref:Uncharacterized protein n=1 Tax=Plakobranchus ocellatus TaxID=259542 RepID=A0AAV4DAP1_9GAST|nr:hypothetical protein PoB_006780900 [Plakobranchus ocellatus]